MVLCETRRNLAEFKAEKSWEDFVPCADFQVSAAIFAHYTPNRITNGYCFPGTKYFLPFLRLKTLPLALFSCRAPIPTGIFSIPAAGTLPL
jgi:hypothetical protein